MIRKGPSAKDIAGKGPKTSLDFPGDPRRPGCEFEQDFPRFGAGEPDVAYAHVATDPSAPDTISLQYWFFWYFDDYVNTHEGDWEFIQIVFPARSAEEALTTTPVEVGYSQHSGGERAGWDDDKLEREGDHPVVYAAAGSHANFFSSNLFLGRNADQGFGCDNATGPSTRLATEARLLPSGTPDPGGSFAWLLFEGRWERFNRAPTTRLRDRGPRGSGAGRSSGSTRCATTALRSRRTTSSVRPPRAPSAPWCAPAGASTRPSHRRRSCC